MLRSPPRCGNAAALLTLTLAAAASLGATVPAQPAAGQAVPAAGAAAEASAAVTADRPFDAATATAAYMAMLSPQAQARSDAYFEGGYWLLLWDFLFGVLLAWLLLETGMSRGMRDLAQRVTRMQWLQTALYGVQYIVLITLLTLPWAAYEGFFREHQYGMSNQTLGAWFLEQLKGLGLAVFFGSWALTALYAVIARVARWWLWGSFVIIAFLVVQIALGPSYLEPVFNKFHPLPDSALKARILSMARANQIPVTQVYEFDASRQTTKMSAHVSGVFGTAQISLNDNLMSRGSREEILAVLGHEMGH